MENIITRYRNLTILVVLLFGQLLGLAVQVDRPTAGGSTRLIRIWAVSAVTPFEKAIVGTGRALRDAWAGYIDLRDVRQRNEELQAELDRLRIERVRLAEDAQQARRLQALLDFKTQYITGTLAAQVIGTTGSAQSRGVYIDKGFNHGVRPDMAVITPDGIVGKVKEVYNSTALVLQINDQSWGAGAVMEKSRLQGILKGTPSGEVLLEYIMRTEHVEEGERVLTSGGERIFPKGLPVGTVARVDAGDDLFYRVRLKPAADLSRLEEVLVVTSFESRSPDASADESPLRAADILAERLPQVPKTEPKTAPTVKKPAPAEPNDGEGIGGPEPQSAPATSAPRPPAANPPPVAQNAATPNPPPEVPR